MIKTIGVLLSLLTIVPLEAMSRAVSGLDTRILARDLKDAATKGRINRVKRILAQGPDLLLSDGEGTTALHAAAKAGHKDIVECLLTYAEEKKVRGTLLMEELQVVLAHQEEDDDDSVLGLILHYGSEYGPSFGLKPELIKTVVGAVNKGLTPPAVVPRAHNRAYIDFRNRHECTALHFAAALGHYDVVKLLLDRGAKQDIRAVEDKRYGGGAIIPGTALHAACRKGHLVVAQHLIERGADIHALDSMNRTVFHNAAMSGSLDLVKFLKERGARTENLDRDEKSAVDLALAHRKYRLAGFLLTDSKSINIRTAEGLTAMHFAAMANDVAWAEELEKLGALPHLTDHEGLMPVHYAADRGNIAMVKWLLDREPDLDETLTDEPFLIRAARKATKEVAGVIIRHRLGRGNNFEEKITGLSRRFPELAISYLEWALAERDIATADHLIECGAQESKEARFIKTLLQDFATGKFDQLFARTVDGATALHCGVKLCSLPICVTICEAFIAQALIGELSHHSENRALYTTIQTFFGSTLEEAEVARIAMKGIIRRVAMRDDDNNKWLSLLDKPLTDESWDRTKEGIEKCVAEYDELAWPLIVTSCLRGLEKQGDRALCLRDALYELTTASKRNLDEEAEAFMMPLGRVSQLISEHNIAYLMAGFALKLDKPTNNAHAGQAAWKRAEDSRYDEEGEEMDDFDYKTELANRIHFSGDRKLDNQKTSAMIASWVESASQ